MPRLELKPQQRRLRGALKAIKTDRHLSMPRRMMRKGCVDRRNSMAEKNEKGVENPGSTTTIARMHTTSLLVIFASLSANSIPFSPAAPNSIWNFYDQGSDQTPPHNHVSDSSNKGYGVYPGPSTNFVNAPAQPWNSNPPANVDFHLLSTSEAINAGLNLTNEIPQDYSGPKPDNPAQYTTPRNRSHPVEIGAYEY
jgi:hypothetical protein